VGNVKENSIEDIMNNDKMRELRLLMLSDKKSDMCLKCYNMEDLGIKSHRLRHNDTFKNHFDIIKNTDADGKIEPNLKFVDVRFSNICNLKCRMCYSGLSSSIAAEENKKIIYLKSLPDYDIFEKQYANFEQIYFAGGEPLLMKEHLDLLEKLINLNFAKNIKLIYNSNITNISFKGINFVNLWKQFKSVRVDASIDSVGKRCEYIRHGTDWDSLEKNIILLKDRVSISILMSVGILNIASVIETHRYLKTKNIIDSSCRLNLGHIMSPIHYSAKIIPEDLREKTLKEIDEYIDEIGNDPFTDHLRSLTNLLKTSKYDQENFDKFLLESYKKDKIRNENLFDIAPEFKKYTKQQ
jgi:sulfatase maturation enzyme AslB (radical SAM superfamily)